MPAKRKKKGNAPVLRNWATSVLEQLRLPTDHLLNYLIIASNRLGCLYTVTGRGHPPGQLAANSPVSVAAGKQLGLLPQS